MKVVVDTNILVSGLLSPHGPPGEVVRLVSVGSLNLCHDARILLEYEQVLSRPRFRFEKVHVQAIVEQISSAGTLVVGRPLTHPLPDPDDEPFLEVAIAGGAEYLVTGDTKHYPARSRQGVRVVTARRFLEACRGRDL